MKEQATGATTAIVLGTLFLLADASMAVGQDAGGKVKPGAAIETDRTPALVTDPTVDRGINIRQFNDEVAALAALETDLDRAFGEFKGLHADLIRAARAFGRKAKSCQDRVYRDGVTDLERRTVGCSARRTEQSEIDCRLRVIDHCRAHESADFHEARARLETKRTELERLLARYERGALSWKNRP